MRKVVFCDFDGTISKEDSTDVILEYFSVNDNWRAVEEDWQNDLIGSRDCLIEQFKDVRASQPDIDSLIKRLHIENGFAEFVRFCKENAIRLYIVSDGISSVIRTFLQIHKITEFDAIYANDIQYLSNGKVKFDCTTDTSAYKCEHNLSCANCKPSIVRHLLQSNNIRPEDAIYIGDGLSDLLGATECGTVFAREKLYSALKQKALTSIKFETFFDIISALSKPETIERG